MIKNMFATDYGLSIFYNLFTQTAAQANLSAPANAPTISGYEICNHFMHFLKISLKSSM